MYIFRKQDEPGNQTSITATLSYDNLYHVDDMTKFISMNNENDMCKCKGKPTISKMVIPTLDIEAIPINHSTTPEASIFREEEANRMKKAKGLNKLKQQLRTEIKHDALTHEIEKTQRRGSARVHSNASTRGLNPLEVLHVKLSHANEALIKHLVYHNLVDGTIYKWADIKDLTLGICDACMKGKMKAFPIPPSMSDKEYGIFEFITVDIMYMTRRSVRGYLYVALFVCKTTTKTFPKLMRYKSELLPKFKELLSENNITKNPNIVEIRYLLSDSDSNITDIEFEKYMRSENITLYTSAPYKKQQNLAERYVYTIKDGMRTVMAYNNCPIGFWCYAITYFCYTFNRLPRMGRMKTRDEEFYGIRTDISNAVPFYASGYFHSTLEERSKDPKGKVFENKATPGIMLGYADSDGYHSSKNSYIILTAFPNQTIIRHDCVFRFYNDSKSPSLLDPDEEQRTNELFEKQVEENYDELFDYETKPNNAKLDFKDIYIPPTILPRGGEPDIPKLINSPFIKMEHPKLPQQEEVLPDQEVMESIQKEIKIQSRKRAREEPNPTVIPKMVTRNKGVISDSLAAIYKALNVKQNENKSKKTANDRNIRCRIRLAVTGEHKETWWPVFQKFINENGFAKLAEKPDLYPNELTIPTTPQHMKEALRGPFGHMWVKGMLTKLKRIFDRNTFTVCPETDQIDPTKKGIKSKLAFRVSRNPDNTWKFRCRLVACGYSQKYGKHLPPHQNTDHFVQSCT